MKNRIRLTESQLHRVIMESAKRIISEMYPCPTTSDSCNSLFQTQDEYYPYAMPDGYDDEWNQDLDDEISDWYGPYEDESEVPTIYAAHHSSNLRHGLDVDPEEREQQMKADWENYENNKLNESKINRIVSNTLKKYLRK